MDTTIKNITSECTDRLISQRQFCLKHGMSPRFLNELERMDVIRSNRGLNPKGTIRYVENETWNKIRDYINRPAKLQEPLSPDIKTKNENTKFQLRRRKKDA